MSRSAAVLAVHKALQVRGWTAAELCRIVEDRGGQLKKWLYGSRPGAPLALRLRAIEELKLPASPVLDSEEIELIRMGARALKRTPLAA